MGRSDRLYALVEELRARSPRLVPRNELAQRLEVSARTVERDILTLQQAGVPIWTQRGRFGGYAIEPSTTLPPLNLEATEAVAVMAALSVLPNHPFAAAGRRAQQKLLAAMRGADVTKAQELAARIRTVSPTDPAPDSEVVRNIERAVVARRVLDLVYGDRRGTSTTRTVEAHGLHLTSKAGYLIGWCRLRDAGRAFRIDRIEKAIVLDEVAPERDLDPMLDWVEGATGIDAGGTAVPPLPARAADQLPWWDGGGTGGADDEAVVSIVRRLVSQLPGVEEILHHGRTAWVVGRAYVAACQGDGRLWVESSPQEIAARTTTSPDVYRRHHGLTVDIDRVDPDELRRLLVLACRLATLASTTDLTWSDVVDAATGLDDVVEADDGAELRRSDGATVARLVPGGASVRLRTTGAERDALVTADPMTFRVADDDAVTVDVDLDAIGHDRLRPLLIRSWHLAGEENTPC